MDTKAELRPAELRAETPGFFSNWSGFSAAERDELNQATKTTENPALDALDQQLDDLMARSPDADRRTYRRRT